MRNRLAQKRSFSCRAVAPRLMKTDDSPFDEGKRSRREREGDVSVWRRRTCCDRNTLQRLRRFPPSRGEFQRNLLALIVFAFAAQGFPQGLECVKEKYTKHEYYISMRDGVRLFASVYIPKDHSVSYPILLSRT